MSAERVSPAATSKQYACRACGWSPNSHSTWCDLGCGRDYNEMVVLPASVVRQLAVGERDRQHIAQLTDALDARPITREHAFRAAQNAVRNQGYAVALHGSQIKDLDLIAVPWQETALTAQDVAELIAAAIPGFIEKGSPEARPNGRLSFSIRPNWHYGFDHWWIDLAVMPRECDWPARAVLAVEEDARP